MTRAIKKTTVAALRLITGLKAKPFADALGCSEATVNSLETGRLKLSETMAQRIAVETGVSLAWLLDGDVSAPVLAADGWSFTIETFEANAAKKQRSDKIPPARLSVDFVNFAGRLHDILSAANRAGGYSVPAYKVGRFLDDMESKGGAPASDWPAVRAAMLADIETAGTWFAELGARGTAGQDFVTATVAQAKPSSFKMPQDEVTKKGEPVKARPRSRKGKG